MKNIIKENELINNNNNIYKKIENIDSHKNNNNINHILNNKNKEKNIIGIKQKNLFLNNKFSKFNHINRIINLKSLNENYNNGNNVKESFFSKYNKIDINQNNRPIN